MRFNSLILQFIGYFILSMIIVNIFATFIGIQFRYIDTIIIIILLRILVPKYIIANNIVLEGKEYWKIFFSLVGAYLVSNFILLLLLFLIFKLKINSSMLVALIFISLFAGAFSILLGLWNAKREVNNRRKTTSKEITAKKVYSVTDEVIATQIINMLLANKIEAFIQNLRTKSSSFPMSQNGNSVDINVKNSADYDKALELIENFFKEKSEIKPWQCPKCKENIEGTFVACWSCGYEKSDI